MWPAVDQWSGVDTKEGLRIMTSAADVGRSLEELARAATTLGVRWALIGGQALIAHGVPRDTLDADALVEPALLGELSSALVEQQAWVPLVYDPGSGDYLAASGPTVHYMDDPVLFDLHAERAMVPLRSGTGLLVELLASQHPIEQAMVDEAALRRHFGAQVPLAPLGGILLVKTKADRTKDIAALEQAAEHLSAAVLDGAVAWAKRHDPASADDLRAILGAARARRAPVRTEAYTRPKPK